MAFRLTSVKVPPNSASLEEARNRVFEFFRSTCRSMPTIMDIYNLDDVVAMSHLRSTIATAIRKNGHVTDPKLYEHLRNQSFCSFLSLLPPLQVIDMLLFKGMEELNNITEHAKQRHHIIGQYVLSREGLVQDTGTKDKGASGFLKSFYKSNYS